MDKTRIYTVLVVNALLIFGAIAYVLENVAMVQYLVIGAATAATVIVPVIFVNKLFDARTRAIKEKGFEIKALKDQLEQLEVKMEQVTTFDDLTGCHNERHFMEVLLQHRAMCERGDYVFTIAVTQIDQFDAIIQQEGLARGHQVLQLFSRIVKAALREVDVLARLDTDRFAMLLSGCNEDDALNIINRVSQLIGQIQVTEGGDISITASGGLTSFHGTESSEELVANAQQALEFAIEQGRDRVAGYLYHPPGEDAAET